MTNGERIIRAVAGADQEVTILVERCLHTCCGGGWTVREYDHLQSYRGKVLANPTLTTFVLRSAPLGKINSVLVEFKDLVDATR